MSLEFLLTFNVEMHVVLIHQIYYYIYIYISVYISVVYVSGRAVPSLYLIRGAGQSTQLLAQAGRTREGLLNTCTSCS